MCALPFKRTFGCVEGTVVYLAFLRVDLAFFA